MDFTRCRYISIGQSDRNRFGFSPFRSCDGLGLYLQHIFPSQFTSMLPYIATLAALFFYSINNKKKMEVKL
jgi:ABC-type uncharacterized transport system permease subunit